MKTFCPFVLSHARCFFYFFLSFLFFFWTGLSSAHILFFVFSFFFSFAFFCVFFCFFLFLIGQACPVLIFFFFSFSFFAFFSIFFFFWFRCDFFFLDILFIFLINLDD